MNREIRNDLIEVAKAGGTTTYGDISPIENLTMSNPDHRNILSEMLMDISENEHKHGRPLLSVVVINGKTGMPGSGFFTLAHDLGLFDGTNKEVFFQGELKRVHDYWKKESRK